VNLSLIAQILWAAGFIEHVVLLVVLIVRGRWRTFPIFTALIGFDTVRTVLLFAIYRYGTAKVYGDVYWSASFLELALQVGIVFEMARVVLKPTGTWVRDARNMFLLCGAAGAVIAAVIAYTINPNASASSGPSFGFWLEKGNLFAIMLTVEVFVSMAFASTQLGLVWTSHVMRLGQGWAVWAVVALVTEGAYSHFGPNWHGVVLDNIRIVTYQVVTIFWIIFLWRPEPKRRTLSPEMQNYLDGLHRQLQSELRSVSNTDKH
jgi:hypothetical protein